jgi:carbon monoxide dehydrogenase subunit G
MKITGEATLHAPVDKVYAALIDPAVLVRTIPGCERLDRVGPDSYRMVVTAGVAAVKGTYAGEVALTDQDEPNGFLLKASGSGAPGTVSAEARVRLAPADGGATTTLTYDADAVVGGMVGGVGQRLLTGVAKKTAGEFFAAVDGVLTGAVPEIAAPEAGMPEAVAPGVGRPEGPAPTGVYLRPARPARAFPGGDLGVGVLLGAGAALAGVVLGAVIARGRR